MVEKVAEGVGALSTDMLSVGWQIARKGEKSDDSTFGINGSQTARRMPGK